MTRQHPNPLVDPLQYASPQMKVGPPATGGAAARYMPSYDYVIVGGGAAGCVVASKLSEDENVSVLLLEAGADSSKIIEAQVPILYGKMFHTENDWDYYTVEQPNMAYRRLYWPRGKLLGGSASMNTMMYHHCAPSDYDEWASKFGCEGWSYKDIAPFFRDMETFTANPERPAIDVQHRGTSGPWQTGYSWLSEIGEKGFLGACEELGMPYNPDINTPAGTLGATRFQTTIDSKGHRSSTATAYLTPEVLERPNLYVACNVRASKVLFDRITHKPQPKAIGVELKAEQNGQVYQVHARREVILSGGTVNTPQTLMLSGIGPAEELKKHGIAPVKENDNVGRHLKDHLAGSGLICKAKSGSTLDYLTNEASAMPALQEWLASGTGPLTSNVAEVATFFRSGDHKCTVSSSGETPEDYTSGKSAPDLEIIGAPIAYLHHGEETAKEGDCIFSLGPVHVRPQSSGSVSLQSRDVFESPVIDPNYLSDKGDNDRKVLMAGLRMAIKIANTAAFGKFLEPVPADDDITSYWWPYSSSNPEAITDEELSRFIDERAFTLYHPVGTARMGPSPATSVVDLACRVHGVGGLRVVDASIFPEQISGHPMAPVGAIANKASAIIKASYAK